MEPERRLWERSSVRRRWSATKEEGKGPERTLRQRKSALRLRRAEKSGIDPEMELDLRLSTRSWSRRPRVELGKVPLRPRLSRTTRTTLPSAEQRTPGQLHCSVAERLAVDKNRRRLPPGSAADLKDSSASASESGDGDGGGSAVIDGSSFGGIMMSNST